MAFTSNDDLNILQASDSQNVGAGAGNDTYIVTPTTMSAGQTINITDTEGANNIKLVGGVTIVSSTVAANSIQLTINNGGIINIFGADTFSYILGGDAFDATSGVSQSFTDFVTNSLGLSAVPTGTNTANGTTTNESVNEDGTIGTPTSTFALAGAATVGEGATANFTLTTTNVADGTTVDYTIAGVSAADVTGGLTGTVTVTGNTATIAVPVVADTTTEGAETLTVSIDGQAGVSASTTVNDTSTTPTTPTFDLAANAANANEGTTATFTLTTTNVADGTSVAYTVSGVDAADVDSLTGTAIVTGNTATISVALTEDNTTEGAETLTVSIDGQTASAVVTVNDTSLDPVNQTFTLTTNPDGVTGGAADDLFVASNATLSAADVLDGGDGTDTLRYASSGAGAVNESGFAASNIENLNIIADATGGTTFDVTGVSGVQKVTNDNSSGNLTLSGGNSLYDLELKNVTDGNTVVDNDASAVTGSSDTQNVVLDSVESIADTEVSSLTVDTGIETVAITTQNGSSQLTDLVAAGANTVTVAGDQNLSITDTLDGIATVDASTFTGNLSVQADAGESLNVTGGTGDDTVEIDDATALSSNDTLNGGAGTDTLSLSNTQAVAGTGSASISNFEQLGVTDAASGTIDMDNFANFSKVILDGGLAAGTTTVDDAVTGITVEVDVTNANTAHLTVDLKTDGSADEVTVALDAVDAGDNIGTITVDDAETLNISADDDTSNGSGTVGVASLVLTDTTTLNLSGDADLTIAAFGNAATPLVATIDASGMTGVLGNTALGSVGATTGLSTVASGATYTFGSGGTDWTMGAIVGTQTGGDTINLGSGTDIIRYTNANQSSGLTSDTVVGFAQGTDIINLQNVVGGPVNTSSLFLGNAANTTAAETALSGTVGQAVFVQSDNALVVDIDGDGNIGAADLRIVMDGITSMTAADLGLVGGVTFTANQVGFNTATAAHSTENNAVGNEADTINATVAQLVGSTVDGLLGADTLNISGTAAANEVANLTGAFTNVETVTLDSTVEGVSMDQDDLTTNAGDTDSETTTITGVSGTTQSLAINNTSDISDVTITNIETLDVTGAATMTLAQHNGFAAITAAGAADSITLDDAGTLTTDADIETYSVVEGSNVTVGTTAGHLAQVITETGGVGTNSTITLGNGIYTGDYTGIDAGDIIQVGTTTDVSGNTGLDGGATIDFQNGISAGAGLTINDTQNGVVTFSNTTNAQTVTVNGAADTFTVANGIESYDVIGGSVVTVNGTNTAVNIDADNTAGSSVIIAGNTVTGTYTLANAGDTITATTGANIAGVNTGNATTAETLVLTGAITMTDAQYDGFTTAINATGAADHVTLTTAATNLDVQADIEQYTFSSSDNDTIAVTTAVANAYQGTLNLSGGGADTITITNAAIAAGTGVLGFTVNNFTAGSDNLVSLGGATSFETITAAATNTIGSTSGAVIEINSAVGEILNVSDADSSAAEGLIAAAITDSTSFANGEDATVILYGNGNAYIYQMDITTADADLATGDIAIELVATLNGVAADSLTSVDFA